MLAKPETEPTGTQDWRFTLGRARDRLRDRSWQAHLRSARAGFRFPARHRNHRGAIWAVTMVRNEADIIEQTVKHLLGQGVDRVLIMDNLSDDATPQILQHLASDPRVLVGQDQERRYFQAAKMTLLARYAWRNGASWVIPFDADEFWIAPGQRLCDFLRQSRADVLQARMFNAYPDGDGFGLDPHPHELTKVAFRAHPLAELTIGNHKVYRAGTTQFGLDIVHVPWRSFEQFRGKLRQGARAFENVAASDGLGTHWRYLDPDDDAGYRLAWRDLLAGRAPKELCWIPSAACRQPISLENSQTWSQVLYESSFGS